MKLQQSQPDGFDVLTWIPVSRLRRIRRGYDQVELLAKAVGRELGIQPVPLLKKVRHNRPQSGLKDAAARRANVLGVYEALPGAEGKHILLVDDIVTSGATLLECARTLQEAGAASVRCVAVAAVRQGKRDETRQNRAE
jgi:ComF family protein